MRGRRRARVGARAVMVAVAVLSTVSRERARCRGRSRRRAQRIERDRCASSRPRCRGPSGRTRRRRGVCRKRSRRMGTRRFGCLARPRCGCEEGRRGDGKIVATFQRRRAKTDRDRGGGDETPDVFGRTERAASHGEQGAGSVAHDETTEPGVGDRDLGAIILLVDFGQVYPDADAFRVPTVLWMPYHHEQPDNSALLLSTYTGIAALAESARRRWSACNRSLAPFHTLSTARR